VGEDHPGELTLKTNLLDKETKEKILYKNAVEFLGLKDWNPVRNQNQNNNNNNSQNEMKD